MTVVVEERQYFELLGLQRMMKMQKQMMGFGFGHHSPSRASSRRCHRHS
jgi:hypothetical protein